MTPWPTTLQPVSETVAPRPLVAPVGVIMPLLAGTVLLWARYGTTVFFETIRAGLVACFG